MPFDFLQVKKSARQALHNVLAVSSKHISAETGYESDCRVRVHTLIKLIGDIDYQGYPEMSDGAVLVHFEKQEAEALNVKAGDTIIYDNQRYVLQTQKDDDGVYSDSWYANRMD